MPYGLSSASNMMQSPAFRRFPRRRVLRAVGAAIALCLVPRPAGSVDPAPVHDAEIHRQKNEIETGFTHGEADRISRLLSQKMKTYVACRMIAEADGYYGPDQVRLLLHRLFRDRTTKEFKVDPTIVTGPGGQAVIRAEWTFRDSGTSTAAIRLAFTLSREAGPWRLREIRDLK
jgi:hypothetical protein